MLDLLKFLTHLAFAGTIFLCSVALTYLMTRFVRVMDMPNPRSSHSRPVPKSGGIAFVATFVIGSVIIYFAAEVARIDDRYFWGYVISAVLLAFVSFPVCARAQPSDPSEEKGTYLGVLFSAVPEVLYDQLINVEESASVSVSSLLSIR